MVPVHCHICLPKGRGVGRPQAFASAAWAALRRPPSHDSSPARGFKCLSAFSPQSSLRRRGLGHLFLQVNAVALWLRPQLSPRGRVVLVVRDQWVSAQSSGHWRGHCESLPSPRWKRDQNAFIL